MTIVISLQIKLPSSKTGTTPQSSPGGTMGQAQQFDKDGAPIFPPRQPSNPSTQNAGQVAGTVSKVPNNNTPTSTSGATIPKVNFIST